MQNKMQRNEYKNWKNDLARSTLLIYALSESCIQKGILTREDIDAAVDEIDLFDGVADGRLDPAVVQTKND